MFVFGFNLESSTYSTFSSSEKVEDGGTRMCHAILDSGMLKWTDITAPPLVATSPASGAPPNGKSSASPTTKMLMGNSKKMVNKMVTAGK